jgi:protein tyrosine/serine phosphatase
MSRRFKITFFIVILVSLCLGYYLYITKQGNFHTITAGEAYRSAQLDRGQLEYYINKYNIKSILMLNSTTANARRYKEELSVCTDKHIAHYFVPLSSRSEPDTVDVEKIIRIFNTAPRPILIHCKQGVDRSGLIAAMWKVVVDKEPKSKAKRQLSLLYFHVPIGRTGSLDRFFDKWQPE